MPIWRLKKLLVMSPKIARVPVTMPNIVCSGRLSAGIEEIIKPEIVPAMKPEKMPSHVLCSPKILLFLNVLPASTGLIRGFKNGMREKSTGAPLARCIGEKVIKRFN